MNNLFSGIPPKLPEELNETLLQNEKLRLERIVSYGHNSAPGFWYDQEESEWVILLSGSAEIEFANGKIANLHAGDYLLIPAHTKHRVKSTSKKEKSVWLALFF